MRRLHFTGERAGDVHVYQYLPGAGRPVTRSWPGLARRRADDGPTPYTEFAVDAGSTESFAVYAGLAWRLGEPLARYAIPTWYRDDAARELGRGGEFVDWEFCVDAEALDPAERVVGFVPARAGVPEHATPWESEHAGHAGLFPLRGFEDLIAAQRALWDASSAINLFAVAHGAARHRRLLASLRGRAVPAPGSVLERGELLIDITVGREPGRWDSIVIVSPGDIRPRLEELCAEFDRRIEAYEQRVDKFQDTGDFLAAMRDLAGLD
ncbi:hypothetical protein [Bailinhaonella thermotolerans]|uniref:Uncharacterized protein n=1 Tax=Bailinhaonella thermotolerans TaxID=1070861 RepID=A0A3A4BCT8_9ACTN|nr:hypothetical protein [Bailinhaonella thermotolerans]RJL32018.1 hypothetical protein D5H75_16420 [Bailinhaonella thermotolerans]